MESAALDDQFGDAAGEQGGSGVATSVAVLANGAAFGRNFGGAVNRVAGFFAFYCRAFESRYFSGAVSNG